MSGLYPKMLANPQRTWITPAQLAAELNETKDARKPRWLLDADQADAVRARVGGRSEVGPTTRGFCDRPVPAAQMVAGSTASVDTSSLTAKPVHQGHNKSLGEVIAGSIYSAVLAYPEKNLLVSVTEDTPDRFCRIGTVPWEPIQRR